MQKKILSGVSVTVILSMLFTLVVGVGTAGAALDEPEAPTIAKRPPIAIGTIPPAGIRYTRPRPEMVEFMLREQGVIPSNATPEQVSAAVSEQYEKLEKLSGDWVNPEIQAWALEREAEVTRLHAGLAPAAALAIQPITATVLVMAVEFSGTDTFTDPCAITQTLIFTGPLRGEMPHPGPNDNQTLWYSPEQTDDPTFYENLIFGYVGAGRTRMDLTDPRDGLAGINLAGYTVQDYYDNVAGPGNVVVTGSVEGWVTIPHSEAYYGAPRQCNVWYDDSGGRVPVAMLAVDAVRVFSDTHAGYYTDTSTDAFWPQYDGNHDGLLDTYWIVHAGMDTQTNNDTFAIASHSGDLRDNAGWEDGYKVYEGDPVTTTDDIYLGPYTMQPENLDLGVLCEEFGHNFFGLPDMYAFDAPSNSVASWNIMSDGVWNGYLGATMPAGMPLWFRMIAACGADAQGDPIPCNWQEPMVERAYDAPMADVTIGQLEKTPDGVNKGIQISLPDYTEEILNPAGAGKAAYSGTGRDSVDLTLSRQIAIPSGAAGVLAMDAYWEIETDYDYGYVMINGAIISDTTGFFTDDDPNGNNLGWGLTDFAAQTETLRFDLSAYAGQSVTLTLRYRTDGAATYRGWWVDHIVLDGVEIENFEAATAPGTFPASWTNSDPGWFVVPWSATYNHYYLLEWRAATKYDIGVRTNYVTTAFNLTDEGVIEWHVERAPYNIPGALLYYRNTKYGATYAQWANDNDPPSFGPKYQILIVDMNPMPLRQGDTVDTYVGHFTPHASSYDAALTLQPSPALTITNYNGITYTYASKPGVTEFNDAKGYYAGYYWGAPCPDWYLCLHDGTGDVYANGSAVIPARGPYSVRLTDFYGDRLGPDDAWLYGYPWDPSWLGTGNPGDDNVQYGVHVQLLSKAGDDAYNSTAMLRFYNQSVDFNTVYAPQAITDIMAGDIYTITYQTVIENTGNEIADTVCLTYTLDSALTGEMTVSTHGTVVLPGTLQLPGFCATTMWPGDVVTVTVEATGQAEVGSEWIETWIEAYDGEMVREFGPFPTEITTPYQIYLPLVMRNF